MNERIRLLAEQAVEIVAKKRTLSDGQVERTWNPDDYDKVFAKLIVEECVDITLEQKKWVEDMKPHNPHDETWNQARIQQSQHIADKIRTHFGLDE